MHGSRRPDTRIWRVIVAAAAMALMLPTAASAMPGDAPITTVSPVNGATVTARAAGIDVIYGCPVYTNIASLPNGGGRRQYGVRFSRSTAVDSTGRLSSVIAASGPDYFADDLPEDRCRATMAASTNPQTTPGTYYWQAHRLCGDCGGGYEVGPISRFTVTLAGPGVTLGLTAPKRAYATYPFMSTIAAAKLPNGVRVVIQTKRNGVWRRIGTGTVLQGVAKAPTTLKLGDRGLRATVNAGGGRTIRSTVRAIAVVRAVSWPSGARWVGGWIGSQTSGSSAANVSWSIVNGGRTMRNVKVRLTATCPSATAPGGFTIQILTVTATSVRVAPNGGFVYAETASSHAVLFFGTLAGLRATGTMKASLGTCVGSLKIAAKHR